MIYKFPYESETETKEKTSIEFPSTICNPDLAVSLVCWHSYSSSS